MTDKPLADASSASAGLNVDTEPHEKQTNESDRFSLAWQDKIHGSRVERKLRLFCYLPFVLPLLTPYPNASVLDLSCGHGEWLETLNECGFSVGGVDDDSAAVAYCQELGLAVQKMPALTALQACAAQSQALISGFGLAETLPFETLRQVVQESLRVLKPGGLLLLQAVNPENITASASIAFLDPRRRALIPRALLEFVPQYAGFALSKAIPLHEQFNLAEPRPISLLNVLQEVSPLYAVIAQKTTRGMVAPPVISAFDQEYGLSLDTLTTRFDQQHERRLQEVAAAAARAEEAIAAIHASFVWRATRPIRWLEQQLEQIQADGVGARIVAFGEKTNRLFVRKLLSLVTGRHGAARAQHFLEKISHQQARVVAQRQSLLTEQHHALLVKQAAPDLATIALAYQTRQRIETLSPEAQAIYARLRQATEQNK